MKSPALPQSLLLLFLSIFMMGNVSYSISAEFETATFSEDLELLKDKVEHIQTLKIGEAQIAVSGEFQGRVFTSTATGENGISLGWFNREVIRKHNSIYLKANMDKLGGESRVWFGPQFGKFATFFEPGADLRTAPIKISPDMAQCQFGLVEATPTSVTYGSDMQILNNYGTIFEIYTQRNIEILSKEQIIEDLDLGIESSLLEKTECVAFSATTSVTNSSIEPWSQDTGLLSIWDLGCMIPSENTVVILPTKSGSAVEDTVVYFTEIDDTRLRASESGALIYKADASYMNKIGIPVANSLDVFGSYNPELNLLTIVKYSLNPGGSGRFVNSQVEQSDQDLYKGEAINIFNGEVNPAEDRNWPFFELESSSDSPELGSGETLTHTHSTYHFVGETEELAPIAHKILGVDLQGI